ncbi:MAG: bifunctional diguanylate cyclase/phosphodiesterase [Gammaproteobacteria bacterium]
MLVVSGSPDNAEAINSVLRNRGIAAHCTRIATAAAFREHAGIGYSLAVVFADEDVDMLPEVLRVRDLTDNDLPVVSCRQVLDPDVLSADIVAGAADLVVLGQRQRLHKVLEREIRRSRMAWALREAVAVAGSYREQLRTFMTGSADAIALVQEGIVMETNPAWSQLFGYADETAMLGTPLMDLVTPDSQAALKGALIAFDQGRWPGDALRCTGLDKEQRPLELQLLFEPAEFDQEPCVRISIAAGEREDGRLLQDLRDAVNKDPLTGFYSRQHFVTLLEESLAQPLRGGVRALAVIRPDAFGNLVEMVGPIASEEVLARMAQVLREHLQPKDLYGRFGGTAFSVLMARGNNRDVRAWADGLCRKLAAQLFDIDGKSVAMTCTVGLSIADKERKNIDELVGQALEACSAGRARGGNCSETSDADEASTRLEESDRLWLPRIKQALLESRFRLARQPIGSLTGQDVGLVDLLVRMIDEQGDEVLPSKFLGAAQRHKLIKNIDRWVIAASLAWLSANPEIKAFVRLSQATILDDTLPRWLAQQFDAAKVEPGRMIFEVAEVDADGQLKATRDLAEILRETGYGFAIEHFGVGSRPQQVLNHVPMDYLKIDGSLMQGLSREAQLQQTVGELVAAARERNIRTIAERVEDANTMAALWQIGIEYIQGYQLMEPEVVLSEEADS